MHPLKVQQRQDLVIELAGAGFVTGQQFLPNINMDIRNLTGGHVAVGATAEFVKQVDSALTTKDPFTGITGGGQRFADGPRFG